MLQRKEALLQVRVCSTIEIVEKLLEMNHIQVLLISEAYPLEDRERIHADKKIVLTQSHCADLGENEKEIMKYQPADKLTDDILKMCQEEFHGALRAGRGRSLIIGVYSPVHKAGKTTFAVKLGKALAQKENVLYLNLETYAGIGGYFPGDEGQDLSHLLYYAKQESGDISVRISSTVKQMGALDYIPPMKVWTDLRAISAQEWSGLLERLGIQSIYSKIILDIGNSVADVFALLKSVDLLFVPLTDDVYAKAKMAQYRYMLEVLNLQELELKSVYIDMTKTMRQSVKEAQGEVERWKGKVTRHAESRAAPRRSSGSSGLDSRGG